MAETLPLFADWEGGTPGQILRDFKALRDNSALIELIAAQQWDGVLPTTMVPGGATPFVNIAR